MVDRLKFVRCVEEDQLMKEAAEGVQERGVEPIWVEPDGLDVEKGAIYVLHDFSSSLYACLVQRCRIVGPLVVLSHLQHGWPLPSGVQPVFNLAMHGVIACFTQAGSKETRERLMQLTKLMGGRVEKDFTKHVTHLIAGQVGTTKYHVARRLRLPVLRPSWVQMSWNLTLSSPHLATESSVLDEHMCLPFTGCTVAVTGLDEGARKRVKEACQKNGGHYTGELTRGVCTHLLVGNKSSAKYKFARQWKIYCVSVNWFHESLATGYCMPEGDYSVEEQDGGVAKGIDLRRKLSHQKPAVAEWVGFLEAYRIPDIVEEDFLEGCKLYLCGFSERQLDKLMRVVNQGGGVRYGVLSAAITHVVVGEELQLHDDTLDRARQMGDSVQLVSPQWLLDCCTEGRRVPEEKYAVSRSKPKVSQSSSLQPSLANKRRAGGDPQADHHTSLPKRHCALSEEEVEMEEEDIMGQYAATTTPSDTTTTFAGVLDGSGVAVSRLFSDGNHQIAMGVVKGNGGQLVAPQYADYLLVPLEGVGSTQEMAGSVQEGEGTPVTMIWLQRSIEARVLIDHTSHFLFHPMTTPISSSTLTNCVLAFSQFSDLEREHLIRFGKRLGAVVQDHFARYESHGLLGSTHLILKQPSGDKFSCSCRWGIPAVSDSWLFECAKVQTIVPVEPHLLNLSRLSNIGSKSHPIIMDDGDHSSLRPPAPQESAVEISSAAAMPMRGREREEEEDGDRFPLRGVVVCSSKRLSSGTLITSLSEAAQNLGALLTHTLDTHTTHYIFQGKATEAVVEHEVKVARERGIFVVSPYWLLQCKDKGTRLQEADFPFTFDPMALPHTLEPERKRLDDSEMELSPLHPPIHSTSEAGGPQLENGSHTSEAFRQLQQHLDELREAPQEKHRRRSRRLQKKESVEPPAVPRPAVSLHPRHTSRKRHGRHSHHGQEQRGQLDSQITDSQDLQVTYDDPESRRQRAKLLARIEREEELLAQGINPKEDEEEEEEEGVEGMKVMEDLKLELSSQKSSSINIQPALSKGSTSTVTTSTISTATITTSTTIPDIPEAPPPVGVPIVTRSTANLADAPSLPLYDEHSRLTRAQKPRFLLSSLDQREKIDYGALIHELGGEYIDQDYFTTKCTHLVVGKASRTEKYLGACAAGKWVLRKSYLEECRSAHRFVWEEGHEWGGGGGTSVSPLESAPRRWRMTLSNQKPHRARGAFVGWKVLVFAEKGKLPGLKRLLEAGGATVAGSHTPSGRRGTTHAFVTVAYVPNDLSLEDLVKEGVQCLRPDYIAEYLSKGRDVPLETFLLK